jgi:hypothetical protein
MLLFCDSFGGYATADIPTRWKGGNIFGGATIDSAQLPPNSQAGAQVLDCTGTAGVLSDNYGSQAHYVLGFRFFRSNTGSSGIICGLVHTLGIGSYGGSVYVQLSNSGSFITDGNNTILATGPIIPYHEWHQFECDFTQGLSGTANLAVYKDGSPTPFLQALGVSTSYAASEQFFLGRPNPSTGPSLSQDNAYFADFYAFNGVAQTVGPYNFAAPLTPQGFGAAKMAFAVPNGAGIVSAWTPNGAATIWQCIDQIPQDGDTTYASDATPGDQYQCTFTALPPMQSLIAVQLSTYARTDDAGPRAYQSGFWHGGTFGYSGVNQFLGGTYNYIMDEFTANPVTGSAWAPADLTGLQFGAKLTV